MKVAATKAAVSARFSSAEYLRQLMSELDRAAICRRIAQAREDAGLTQRELGEALSPQVHWRTVQNWERGENIKKQGIHRWTVPWDRLSEIAELTGVTKEWLLHGESAPAPAAETDEELRLRLERIEQLLQKLVARASQGGRSTRRG